MKALSGLFLGFVSDGLYGVHRGVVTAPMSVTSFLELHTFLASRAYKRRVTGEVGIEDGCARPMGALECHGQVRHSCHSSQLLMFRLALAPHSKDGARSNSFDLYNHFS